MISLQITRICWREGGKGRKTLWWHPNKVRSMLSAGLSQHLMFSCQQYSSVSPPFHQQMPEHCIGGSECNPQQVNLQARVFFPIDSEKQSPSPLSVCDWWPIGDWCHLKQKYFTAFLCNVVVYLHCNGNMPDVLKSHKNSPPFQLCKWQKMHLHS